MKILFLSIAAPPKSGAESLQVGRYLSYLSQQSTIMLVTTPAINTGWAKKDMSQTEILNKVDQVIFQNSLNSWNKWARFVGSILMKIQSNTPDNDFLFHLFPRSVKDKLIVQPDLIYSRSSPFSSAVLGLKMKRLLGIPWCMHLSDPWTDSPYVNYQNKYNLNAERSCFENADLISFTTQETLDFYSEKYPNLSTKFFISPNVFSPEEVNASTDILKNEKLVFLHSGNLYGKRNLTAILTALKLLEKSEQDQIEVQLAGNMDQENLNMIKASGTSCIKNFGFINADLSFKLQRKADILVSIDKPLELPIDRVFLPSKIQDYIAARKPIIAITGNLSATFRTVHDHYGKCFDHEDTEGLLNFIRISIDAFKSKDRNYFLMPEPSMDFDARYNVGKLLNKFHQLIKASVS